MDLLAALDILDVKRTTDNAQAGWQVEHNRQVKQLAMLDATVCSQDCLNRQAFEHTTWDYIEAFCVWFV